MYRRDKKSTPEPLPSQLLATFLDDLKNGRTERVEICLAGERRLANAKVGDTTPLMTVVSSDIGSTVQIQLINILVSKGADLSTRDPTRHHALLLACKSGVEPSVVQCLLGWSTRNNRGQYRWSHCNDEKQSALELSVLSGNISLVRYILEQAPFDEWNNDSADKIISAAILSKNEELVLYLLGRNDILDDFNDDVDICAEKAAKCGIINSLQIMYSINKEHVGAAIWLLWYESQKQSIAFHSRLIVIAERFMADKGWMEKRNLLLLRQRILFSAVPDDVFRYEIAAFLCPKHSIEEEANRLNKQQRIRRANYWCSDCEGWFESSLDCYCSDFSGYYS
jgi:ankyrin repeat protein